MADLLKDLLTDNYGLDQTWKEIRDRVPFIRRKG